MCFVDFRLRERERGKAFPIKYFELALPISGFINAARQLTLMNLRQSQYFIFVVSVFKARPEILIKLTSKLCMWNVVCFILLLCISLNSFSLFKPYFKRLSFDIDLVSIQGVIIIRCGMFLFLCWVACINAVRGNEFNPFYLTLTFDNVYD